MTQNDLQKKYAQETADVLRKSQEQRIPGVWFRGRMLQILPGVFSPAYFEDTFFFAEAIPILSGQAMLEVGTGTGAIAIACAERGASRVLAVDLNPAAVQNAQENVHRFGLQEKIAVRQSDVFSTLLSGERFDVLFWNVPFADRTPTTMLERAIFDEGYQAIRRYIEEAHAPLAPDGRLFLGFSDTLGSVELLTAIATQAGYRLVCYATRACHEGTVSASMDVYELCKI